MQTPGFVFKGQADDKHGMSMGGIGTGTLSLDRAGRFQDITVQNHMAGRLKPTPMQHFFAVYARSGNRGAGRLLQLTHPSGLPCIAGLTYHGHFPVTKIRYRDSGLPCDIALEAFSPFVPQDALASSLPLVFFDFRLQNQSRSVIQISVAASWQNDIAVEPFFRGQDPRGNINRRVKDRRFLGVLMATRNRVVAGSEYLLAGLAAPGVAWQAVSDWWQDSIHHGQFMPLLEAGDVSGHRGTHVLRPDDQPVLNWQSFLQTGKLPAEARPDDDYGPFSYHCPAAAVSGTVRLKPGEEKTVSFALAWFFPHNYGDRPHAHTCIGHQYARRFPGGTRDILVWTLPRREKLAERSRSWRELIDRSSLPPATRNLIVNLLYLIPRSSWWLKDGRFVEYESPSCINMQNGGDYWVHSWSAFFPDLTAGGFRNYAAFQRPSGELPIFLGVGEVDNPVFWKGTALPGFGLGVYWAWQMGGGGAGYLRDLYPVVKKAFRFMMRRDEDGDGVPDSHGIDQAFDTYPMYGAACYIASHCLAELAAVQAMAEFMGDAPFARWCRDMRRKTTATVEKKLWNGRYYRLYADPVTGRKSDACFLHQIEGQLFADILGLGRLYPEDHLKQALDAIWALDVKGCRYGARTAAMPDGRGDKTALNPQSNCFNLLSVGLLCGLSMRHGKYDEALKLIEKSAGLYLRMTRDPWYGQYLFDADSGKHFYGFHYPPLMGIWHVLLALTSVQVNHPERQLTLAPPRIPVRAPLFTTLLFGEAEFSRRPGRIELRLTNAAAQSAHIRQLEVRLPVPVAGLAGTRMLQPDAAGRYVFSHVRIAPHRDWRAFFVL